MFINIVNQNINNLYIQHNTDKKVQKIENISFQNSLSKFKQPKDKKDNKKGNKNKILKQYIPKTKE